MKPLGLVLQIEECRVTLPHLNVCFLVALALDVIFLDIISLNLEGESFSWEVSLLGNLRACFHCKLNGHIKKNYLTCNLHFEKAKVKVDYTKEKILEKVYVAKDLGKDGTPSTPKGKLDGGMSNQSMPTKSPSKANSLECGGFLTLDNPLYDKDFEVILACQSG